MSERILVAADQEDNRQIIRGLLAASDALHQTTQFPGMRNSFLSMVRYRLRSQVDS